MDTTTINAIITLLTQALWPTATILIIFKFAKEIKDLLKRIKKGKFFGQEFELFEKIDQFGFTTEQASEEVTIRQPSSEVINQKILTFDDVKEVLRAAVIKPELGIMMLTPMLEREIINLGGVLGTSQRLSARKSVQLLVQKGYLPELLVSSINQFWELRNKIVHGHSAPIESQAVLRVIDIGLHLLGTIRGIQGTIVFQNSNVKNNHSVETENS